MGETAYVAAQPMGRKREMTMPVSYGVPYMGSKNLIAAALMEQLPPAEVFVDLFAGGCAMTHAAMVSGKYKRFIANDLDFRGPTLFRDALAGKYHDEKRAITREEFHALRKTDPFVALCWSFGDCGRTYLWDKEIEEMKLDAHRMILSDSVEERRTLWAKIIRDIAAMGGGRIKHRDGATENIARLARVQSLEGVGRVQSLEVSVGSYDAVEIPADSVVYCDPPYAGKAEYAASDFDHDRFYDWLRTRDFPVWVSEYAMPSDFKRIWAREKKVVLRYNDQKAMEGLFVHEKWADKVPRMDLFGFDGFD